MRGLLGKESQSRTLARKRQTERERERERERKNTEDDGRLHSNGMKGHLWNIESGCGNRKV